MNQKLVVSATTENAIIIGAHSKAVDGVCVFGLHFLGFGLPFEVVDLIRRPKQNPKIFTARGEPRSVIREFNGFNRFFATVQVLPTEQRFRIRNYASLIGWKIVEGADGLGTYASSKKTSC